MTAWRYSINYGPDGEENFANVYAADGQFVGNLRTHHAVAICHALEALAALKASEERGAAKDARVKALEEVLTKAKAFHDRDSGCNGFTADYECLRWEINDLLGGSDGQ